VNQQEETEATESPISVASVSSCSFSILLDVVAEQHALVAQVQPAVGDDRVWPGRPVAVVGLFEASALLVAVGSRFDERDPRRLSPGGAGPPPGRGGDPPRRKPQPPPAPPKRPATSLRRS